MNSKHYKFQVYFLEHLSLATRPTQTHSLRVLVTLFLVFLLNGCGNDENSQNPTTLRFSVLPDQEKRLVEQRYMPLMAYLEKETQIKCELVHSRDYEDLLGKFLRGEINIARFGGATFSMARTQGQAKPLVMRDIDKEFKTYFLVRANDSGKTISDFKNKRFGFGSRLSTSGHIMPTNTSKQKIKITCNA